MKDINLGSGRFIRLKNRYICDEKLSDQAVTDTIKSLSNIKIQSRSSKQIVKFHRQKNALTIISFHMVSNCYDSKQAK